MRKSMVIVLAYLTYLAVIEKLLPKSTAIRIAPNDDEFTVENQRSRIRTRQNYVVQSALDDGISSRAADEDSLSADPILESFEESPEGLTAEIVDYANMIRNNIIFLDNSVETTTRKRANMKKKNQAGMNNCPHTCKLRGTHKILDSNYYPNKVPTVVCGSCVEPYICTPVYYMAPVLRRITLEENSSIPVEYDFRRRWTDDKTQVTAFCVCASGKVETNYKK